MKFKKLQYYIYINKRIVLENHCRNPANLRETILYIEFGKLRDRVDGCEEIR